MTFLQTFQNISGITDPVISSVLAGSLFLMAVSIVFGCLIKTFFRN